MRCVICHCEPVSAPSPLLPLEPPSLGDLSGSGPGGEGAGGGEVNLLIQYTMEKGIGDPATEPNTWMSPRSQPRQWAGEGGFKGSSFIPPPLPWGWPPAPSFPSSSPPRPGRDWRSCTQLGRGLGAVGGHPDLAAVQAAGGCTRCLGRPRVSSWAGVGGAGLCRRTHLGTAWHSSPWLFHPPQQRNRRGKPMGKVNCKNMKQDCPVPTCPRATLLPGHCCHTCPKGEASRYLPVGILCIQRVPQGHRKGGHCTHPPERGCLFSYGACQCPRGAHEVLGRGKP